MALKNTFLISSIYKRKLSIAWILAVVAVVGLGYFYQGNVALFQGIAEASETIISVPSATEIVKVHVMPGQEIKAGDTIVELNRPDLTLRINEVTRELDAIEGRSSLNKADIDQRVASVKADLATRSAALRFEINRLETEYQKNKEISSKLKSLSGNSAKAGGNDGMAMQIKNLKDELALAEKNANEQIALLEQLKKEQADLVQIAKESWVVGSVNVREGEKVSSFTPIVTLTHKSPSLIRGYINEQVYQRMNLGKDVEIRTLGGKGKPIKGEVVGLSSRIVVFPDRMWKMPDMPVYGREVTIKISEENPFLLGEMVAISEEGKIKDLATQIMEAIFGSGDE